MQESWASISSRLRITDGMLTKRLLLEDQEYGIDQLEVLREVIKLPHVNRVL
jgi:hypothetical protein